METLVVSVLGGLSGLAFAWWGVRVMVGLLPRQAIPTELNLTPDLRVLGFAFAASLLTGILCGLDQTSTWSLPRRTRQRSQPA